MTVNKSRLIGKWDSDPAESQKSTIYFGRDDKMAYVLHEPGHDSVIRLIYRMEDDALVTTQPSDPHEEWTPFEVDADGRLILTFGGRVSRYIKVAG